MTKRRKFSPDFKARVVAGVGVDTAWHAIKMVQKIEVISILIGFDIYNLSSSYPALLHPINNPPIITIRT